jgi:hypothetical protein
MIRPETSNVLDEEVVTDAQQTAVGVFRGASNAKAICDDVNCTCICGVLGKFADAQKADFVKLITAIITYAPPGYTPPDRKKLDGPLLDVRYQRTNEKVGELLNQLGGMCGLTSSFPMAIVTRAGNQPVVNYVSYGWTGHKSSSGFSDL